MPRRRVFLRNLVLSASIGIYPHEQLAPQRVRVNVELEDDDRPGGPHSLSNVVDYERVAIAIRSLVASGHVRLVETLAERIATECFVDPRVQLVRVRVEKLDVFEDAESAGVEIERGR